MPPDSQETGNGRQEAAAHPDYAERIVKALPAKVRETAEVVAGRGAYSILKVHGKSVVGLFDTNVISDVFGSGTLTDIVYLLVGACGLLYIPRLLDSLHISDHTPHVRGT